MVISTATICPWRNIWCCISLKNSSWGGWPRSSWLSFWVHWSTFTKFIPGRWCSAGFVLFCSTQILRKLIVTPSVVTYICRSFSSIASRDSKTNSGWRKLKKTCSYSMSSLKPSWPRFCTGCRTRRWVLLCQRSDGIIWRGLSGTTQTPHRQKSSISTMSSWFSWTSILRRRIKPGRP